MKCGDCFDRLKTMILFVCVVAALSTAMAQPLLSFQHKSLMLVYDELGSTTNPRADQTPF